MPFGKHDLKHAPLHRRELEVRKVASHEETNGVGVRLLIKMVKPHEHPDLIKKAHNELSAEENRELKLFPLHVLSLKIGMIRISMLP